MYRYMHSVRVYNSADEAGVRPVTAPEPLAQVRGRLDYAGWYLRLRGATSGRPEASSPVSVYQLDYATWQSRLQPANAAQQTAVALLVDFVSAARPAQPDQQAA